MTYFRQKTAFKGVGRRVEFKFFDCFSLGKTQNLIVYQFNDGGKKQAIVIFDEVKLVLRKEKWGIPYNFNVDEKID
jgi:hypothetical protein